MGASVVDSGVVTASKLNSAYPSNAYAWVCALDTSRWLCVWRAAPSKSATVDQHVLVCWSDDAGRSWSDPIEPFSSRGLPRGSVHSAGRQLGPGDALLGRPLATVSAVL
jgi:hypothetical protein